MCGLPGFDREKALTEIFLPWLREDRVTHAPPSSYWCAYPLDLLASQGYGEDVVAFIKRHWKAMAAFGSCFENFDPQPEGADMLSHSHAWSAHPLYLLMRTLGGVRQTAPGWQTATVDPVFVGNQAETVVPTPHGPIHVHWKQTAPDAKPNLKIKAPNGVRLPSNFSRSEK
jgi:alpha-L-rhamnosidase